MNKKFFLAVISSLFAVSFAHAVTLHYHNGGDPASLDPHKVSGTWENRIVGEMFEGLMTEDKFANPIPGAAESFTVSDDGLTYIFNMRRGNTWSDGTPVTAHDFVFAFRRIMDPATAAKYAWLQYPIMNAEEVNKGEMALDKLGVTAIDDNTLEVKLKSPTPYFLTSLTHYTAYPIPQHAFEKHGEEWVKPENLVVNGPYIAVEWVPGSHVKSIKNSRHYDYDKLQIDEIIYYVLEDEAAALRRYEAGEFDILTSYPVDQISRLRKEIPDHLRIAPFAGVYYYTPNVNLKPLDNVRVREALSMAINRDVITQQVLGSGEQSAYSWVPPGTANYGDVANITWHNVPYAERLENAIQIMTEEGYGPEGQPLNFTLRYNTNDNHKRVAVAVAAMWKQLGVEIELFNSEVKVHYEDLNNNEFEIARAAWIMDYNDPIGMLGLLQSENLYNYGRWNNSQFDSLLKQSENETDLAKRAEILYNAERIAMDDHASFPIYYYVSTNIVNPSISGYENNTFDVHRVRYMEKN